jgi:hypothetical protein
LELSNRHGVAVGNGGDSVEVISLSQHIRGGITIALSSTSGEFRVSGSRLLVTVRLGAVTDRWEAHNVVDNVDNLGNFLWKVIRLGHTRDDQVSLKDRAERGKFSVEHGVGDGGGHGDLNHVLKTGHLVVLHVVGFKEICDNLDRAGRRRQTSLDLIMLDNTHIIHKQQELMGVPLSQLTENHFPYFLLEGVAISNRSASNL